jgi:hypothetical protein
VGGRRKGERREAGIAMSVHGSGQYTITYIVTYIVTYSVLNS